jgi:hypothetical protein
MCCCPWESRSPRLGAGYFRPKPRKSRPTNAIMAPEIEKGRKVMMGVPS